MATRVPELAMFSVLLTAILSCVSFVSRSATFVSISECPLRSLNQLAVQ